MHGLYKEFRHQPHSAAVARKKLTRPRQGGGSTRGFLMPVARQLVQDEFLSEGARQDHAEPFTAELPSGVNGMESDARHTREDVRERLAEELETEIIPRLLLAHGNVAKAVFSEETLAVIDKSVQARELSRIAIGGDASAVISHIEKLVRSGTRLETVLTDVMAGAARHMGRQWESDELDFVQVTIGVSNLQQAFRHLLIEHPTAFSNGSSTGHSALFVAAADEQHTFGLLILEETFRCRGWNVRSSIEFDYAQLLEVATNEPIDLVGFSLSCESRLDQLAEQINTLRSASLSPDLVIIVGGNVFLDNPGLWKKIGADGSAPDAIEALLVGDKLVRARQLAQKSSA